MREQLDLISRPAVGADPWVSQHLQRNQQGQLAIVCSFLAPRRPHMQIALFTQRPVYSPDVKQQNEGKDHVQKL